MKYQVVKKGVQISAAIEERIIEKLYRLEKMLNKSEKLECRILIKAHGNAFKVEVTIPTQFLILRSEVESDEILDAVDIAKERLESQIRKMKTRLNRNHNKTNFGKAFLLSEIETEEVPEPVIVRNKEIKPEPMTLDDAIMAMEMIGHSFYIYLDIEDQSTSIVYKRLDGGYGVLEIVN